MNLKGNIPVSANFITFGAWANTRSTPMSITSAEIYYDSATTPWLFPWGFWRLKAKDAASWVTYLCDLVGGV